MMRIIAGEHKGRHLKAVQGKDTRPTGDKIKEAIFHKMGPFFDGGEGLDLFAGSGSLGLEALSRGFDFMTFTDTSSKAIKVIHENIQLLHMVEKTSVYKNNALRTLHTLIKQKKEFALILIDPPYDKGLYQKLLITIAENNLVADGGFIYLEYRTGEHIILPKGFNNVFEKQYNETTSVTILQKVEN